MPSRIFVGKTTIGQICKVVNIKWDTEPSGEDYKREIYLYTNEGDTLSTVYMTSDATC